MSAIDACIEAVGHLPPLPQNLVQLLDLLKRSDVDASQVVHLITYDPALTANVMRLCNSAYFGASEPVADLHEAVVRLGFNEVHQLALALGAARTLAPAQPEYGIEACELWRHSVTAALAAKTMALDRNDNVSMVFTAGILHDVGKIVLAHSITGGLAALREESEAHQQTLVSVERRLFGFDHAQVGARLLERWHFHPDLIAAVRFHHDPAAAGEHASLAAYVYLGNMIACIMGRGCGYRALALAGQAQALEFLGMASGDLPQYMIRTLEGFQAVEGLFAVPTGA